MKPSRIVTHEQLRAGYKTGADGYVVSHAYKVIARLFKDERPNHDIYLVEEPPAAEEYEP